MLQIHNIQITYRDISCICGKLPIIYIHEVERLADYSNYFAKQMTFKLPTTLVNHLEQEIYEKLESAVELRAAEWNGDWAAREQKGEKYHFYMVTKWIRGEAKEVEKKVNWHKHVGGLLNIEFFQTEPDHEWDEAYTDYYRPKNCTVNYEACKENAKAQTRHSVGLLESRINGHLAVTDKITDINLALGNGYFIEGFVIGTTEKGEEFKIYTKMIWNYRYGANSANGYLTQYVQFRSDRRGARQEGKTVLQRLTEQEKQAKADAKQAELIAKNEAKWDRFRVLPDQINRWADKGIKKHEKMLSEDGLKKAEQEFNKRYGWYDAKFDLENYKRWVTEDLNEFKMYKTKIQKWLNNEPAVREVFGLDCNTRDDFKYVVCKG